MTKQDLEKQESKGDKKMIEKIEKLKEEGLDVSMLINFKESFEENIKNAEIMLLLKKEFSEQLKCKENNLADINSRKVSFSDKGSLYVGRDFKTLEEGIELINKKILENSLTRKIEKIKKRYENCENISFEEGNLVFKGKEVKVTVCFSCQEETIEILVDFFKELDSRN